MCSIPSGRLTHGCMRTSHALELCTWAEPPIRTPRALVRGRRGGRPPGT
jgi:hypothetical protein